MIHRIICHAVIIVASTLLAVGVHGAKVVALATGAPLPKASVFDNRGVFVGVCSDFGELPAIDLSSYPLTVRMIGYSPATIDSPDIEEIALEEIEYELPEIVVDSKRHKVLHLIGYVREYSTLSTYTDTVVLFREKTVDFMIPTKRADKYKGWTNPRVLASKSYYHFSNSEGLDSVSKYFRQNFSWSDLVGIFSTVRVPEKLGKVEEGADTIYGKYSPTSIWRKTGGSLYLDNDILGEIQNREWMPELFKLFSRNVDFTKFNIGYVFSGHEGDRVFADDIASVAFNIESFGKGDYMKRVMHTNDPIYMTTYGEIYITDREYISVGEARKWEKNPPLGDEIGIKPPQQAPMLSQATQELVNRVNNFDYTAALIDAETDKAYKVMNKFNHSRKKKGIIKKVLGKIFQ